MLLFCIALFLLPFAFLDKGVRPLIKKIILFVFIFIFIILSGVRWNTGTDWRPYEYAFSVANNYYDAVQSPIAFEWGYGMLLYVVNTTTGSYTLFLLLFAVLTIFLKYKVIIQKEFVGYALLSFFMYYCYTIGDIVSTRQSLAVTILFFSIKFIIDRKIMGFFLLVCLATLIHRSSIIFIFSYYIYHLNLSNKLRMKIFFASMIGGAVMSNLSISLNIPFLAEIQAFSKYQEKLEAYNELGQVAYGQGNIVLLTLLGVVKKILFIFPALLLIKDTQSVQYRLLNLIIFGSVLYFILGAIASDFKRFNTYFEIFEILVIPYAIYMINTKWLRYLAILVLCVILLIRLQGALFIYWDLYHPFYTIFDFHNQREMW